MYWLAKFIPIKKIYWTAKIPNGRRYHYNQINRSVDLYLKNRNILRICYADHIVKYTFINNFNKVIVIEKIYKSYYVKIFNLLNCLRLVVKTPAGKLVVIYRTEPMIISYRVGRCLTKVHKFKKSKYIARLYHGDIISGPLLCYGLKCKLITEMGYQDASRNPFPNWSINDSELFSDSSIDIKDRIKWGLLAYANGYKYYKESLVSIINKIICVINSNQSQFDKMNIIYKYQVDFINIIGSKPKALINIFSDIIQILKCNVLVD